MSELLANLALGFSVAAHPYNIGFCLLGALVGTLVGVLPGIGTVATVAMLLPITFGLPPVGALIMLAGIYYGAQYGGSTTSILVNIPGEATSVVTAIDGHQMAKQGRAGPALGMAALASFVAGTFAIVALMLVAPFLARVAVAFGPAEYFSLMVLGLTVLTFLTHGSMAIRWRGRAAPVLRFRLRRSARSSPAASPRCWSRRLADRLPRSRFCSDRPNTSR